MFYNRWVGELRKSVLDVVVKSSETQKKNGTVRLVIRVNDYLEKKISDTGLKLNDIKGNPGSWKSIFDKAEEQLATIIYSRGGIRVANDQTDTILIPGSPYFKLNEVNYQSLIKDIMNRLIHKMIVALTNMIDSEKIGVYKTGFDIDLSKIEGCFKNDNFDKLKKMSREKPRFFNEIGPQILALAYVSMYMDKPISIMFEHGDIVNLVIKFKGNEFFYGSWLTLKFSNRLVIDKKLKSLHFKNLMSILLYDDCQTISVKNMKHVAAHFSKDLEKTIEEVLKNPKVYFDKFVYDNRGRLKSRTFGL